MLLIKKTFRDIRKNRVQFLAIFLMMFFGCFLFSGITGEWNGLKTSWKSYIDRQELADQWAYKKAFSKAELEKLKSDKRVEKAEGRLFLPMNLEGKDKTSIDCYFAQTNMVSRLYIKSGEAFNSSKKGIWLDELFARENGYKTDRKAHV